MDLFYLHNLVRELQKCEIMAGSLHNYEEFGKNIQSEMQKSESFAV